MFPQSRLCLFAFVSVFFLFVGPPSWGDSSVETKTIELGCPFYVSAKVDIHSPAGVPKGDILYLHGLGDNKDNHEPLISRRVKDGYRVIAVDLPSHGQTEGSSLNRFTFRKLGSFILSIEKATRDPGYQARPLILEGWSTGGLLAVRMVQMGLFEKHDRKAASLVLYAPGLSVPMFVGEWGKITERTLTRNLTPPHHGDIHPTSPFCVPLFAACLKFNSWMSRLAEYPVDLPTLIFLGGEKEDRYIKTAKVKAWVQSQIALGKAVWGVQFAGAFHELDNEPAPVGGTIRDFASAFLQTAVEGQLTELLGAPRFIEIN